jgi:hypothetical protein
MLEFIKMFGLGILYTILFPFIVLIFALYLVYVFVNYLIIEGLTLFGFFFGYTFTVETELERKLREMKETNKKSEENHGVSYEYDPSLNEVSDGEGSDTL